MTLDCNIIKDLLPLYADGVCSGESRAAVERHLKGCETCSGYLAALRSDEMTAPLLAERASVLAHERNLFRKKTLIAGLAFACALLVPLLVCLIVGLASGGITRGFFILSASLLLAASLTVVPLTLPRFRFFCSCASALFCLLLLLLICSGGSGWFPVAAVSVAFGTVLVLLPVLLRFEPLNRVPRRLRAVVSLAADTVLYFLMMLVIGLRAGGVGFGRTAFAFSLPALVFVWLELLIAAYLPRRASLRAGVCVILGGGFLFTAENLVRLLLKQPPEPVVFYPLLWRGNTLAGNLRWVILLLSLILGIILLFRRSERRNDHDE